MHTDQFARWLALPACVHTYNHLGGWVHADTQPRHAIRDRIASARQAWGLLVRPFLGKKVLQLKTKVQVLQSLVVSRLTYNMHVLTKLTPKIFQEWEACIRPMVGPLARPFLHGMAPFQFTAATLCGLVGVLAPGDPLHVNRLGYVKRLLLHCPGALWHLLHELCGEPHSWLCSLRSLLNLVDVAHTPLWSSKAAFSGCSVGRVVVAHCYGRPMDLLHQTR